MKSKIVTCVTTILLVSGVLIGMVGCTDKSAVSSSTGSKKTSESVAVRDDLVLGTTVDGKIALSFTGLNFEMNGILKKVNVSTGEKVKKGQILAKIDDMELRQELTLANNKYNQAVAAYNDALAQKDENLLQAKISLKQAKERYKENKSETAVRDEYKLAKKRYERLLKSDSSISSAKLQLRQAKDDRTAAKENTEKAYLRAPAKGTVISIKNKVGELVTGSERGGFMEASTAFIVICNPNVINVTSSVTESDVLGITVGNQINISVDAAGLEGLKGKITEISSIPTTDTSGIVSYGITAKLDKADEVLRDGMNCLITILKKELKDVLLIPDKAVFIENNRQYVNVKKEDGSIEKREVTGGLSNGSQTEISQGLQEGETVIIGSVKQQ